MRQEFGFVHGVPIRWFAYPKSGHVVARCSYAGREIEVSRPTLYKSMNFPITQKAMLLRILELLHGDVFREAIRIEEQRRLKEIICDRAKAVI